MNNRLSVLAFATAFSSLGLPQTHAAPGDPDAIVKSLYQAEKADSGPFNQTTNRAVVDRYFRKDLADLIWKDAVAADGEMGALDFAPFYGSQDPQIKKFRIMETGWGGDKKFGGEDDAVVQVTFTDSGKEQMVSFQFERNAAKEWKIFDIKYPEGRRLAEILAGEAATGATEPSSSS